MLYKITSRHNYIKLSFIQVKDIKERKVRVELREKYNLDKRPQANKIKVTDANARQNIL